MEGLTGETRTEGSASPVVLVDPATTRVNPADQLLSMGTKRYGYDANGALRYVYDDQDGSVRCFEYTPWDLALRRWWEDEAATEELAATFCDIPVTPATAESLVHYTVDEHGRRIQRQVWSFGVLVEQDRFV